MRSILVLGDKRQHNLSGRPVDAQSAVYGGVELMRGAIESVLSRRKISRPEVWAPYSGRNYYSLFNASKIQPVQMPSNVEMLGWVVKETQFESSDATRYCLHEPKAEGQFCLPAVEFGLLHRLLLGGFDRPRESGTIALNGKHYRNYLTEMVAELRSQGVFHKAGVLREVEELKDLVGPNKQGHDHTAKTAIENAIAKLVNDYQAILASQQSAAESRCVGPDVLVFDDLGLQAGSLEFPILDSCPMSEAKEFLEEAVGCYYRELIVQHLAEEVFKAGGGTRRHFDEVYASRARTMKSALQILISRFHAVSRRIGNSGVNSPAEPVIVLSAANCVPNLECNNRRRKTIWQHLHQNDSLRRRTVVIFDANALREEISISSALSWERTGQETIVEFQRNRKLRPYLKFGHIVIRFGLTGALVISNDRDSVWRFTLYFNPDRDDREWTHQENGVVLGATSVVAATIVEKLVERCNWRNGKARLPDVDQALDDAMLLSIQRMVHHFQVGHGSNPSELRKTIDEASWFRPDGFLTRAELMDPANLKFNYTRISPQRVSLLPYRSRHWSILAQSVQADLNDVARSIVSSGPKVILNTIENPVNDFVSLWVESVLETLVSDSGQNNRLCSLFFDKANDKKYFKPNIKDDSELACELVDFLSGTIGGELARDTRRLVGDSIFNTLRIVEQELTSTQDTRAREALEDITGSLFHRRDRLNQMLSQDLADALVRDSATAHNKTDLVNELKQGIPQDHSWPEFLLGFDELVKSLKKTMPTQPLTRLDEFIAVEFGRLRRAVLYGAAKPNNDHKCRAEVSDIMSTIDQEHLAEPRVYLENELVEMVRSYEPEIGWVPPISAPVFRLGRPPKKGELDTRLAVIDRKEVESIRAVKRMIEQYLLQTKETSKEQRPERPLSIAVFGPPGSGKSVAVKKIIKMMESTGATPEQFTVNLSQLSKVEELEKEIQRIKNHTPSDHVPIVFFDEFDSALDHKNGWLRHFLAIMEDGKYKNVEIKQGVFVFAGGTSSTFEEFSLANHSRNDQLWVQFSDVKGPDFVSRLKGHINMVGINPSNPDDDLYLIRRALALRFQLAEKQNLSDSAEANIDPNILSAFLHVPEYIHGARSLRMLVELCSNRDRNGQLSMSEVPPIHQLDMQVDGKAFAALASGQTKPTFNDTLNTFNSNQKFRREP